MLNLKTFTCLMATLSLAACNLPPAPGSLGMSGGNDMMMEKTFTLTLESVPNGPSPLSPGVYVIHRDGMPLFSAGQPDRQEGLERIAEDGDPADLGARGLMVFNMPVGDSEAGPATPGKKFEITFKARPGDRLSFATMYGKSNDSFYAPAPEGLALFNGTAPVTGDISSQIILWDAGTEVNQQPGTTTNQAAMQTSPNMGESESQPIQPTADRDDFDYGQALQAMLSVQ